MGNIEITPAMEEAGAAILVDRYECALEATAPRVAREIFQAMLSAQGAAADE